MSIVILVGINYVSICSYNDVIGELRWERNVENPDGKVGTYAEFSTICRLNKNCFALLLGSCEEAKILRFKFSLDSVEKPLELPGVGSGEISVEVELDIDEFQKNRSVNLRRTKSLSKKKSTADKQNDSKNVSSSALGVPVVIEKERGSGIEETPSRAMKEIHTPLNKKSKRFGTIGSLKPSQPYFIKDGSRRQSEILSERQSPLLAEASLKRKREERELTYLLNMDSKINPGEVHLHAETNDTGGDKKPIEIKDYQPSKLRGAIHTNSNNIHFESNLQADFDKSKAEIDQNKRNENMLAPIAGFNPKRDAIVSSKEQPTNLQIIVQDGKSSSPQRSSEPLGSIGNISPIARLIDPLPLPSGVDGAYISRSLPKTSTVLSVKGVEDQHQSVEGPIVTQESKEKNIINDKQIHKTHHNHIISLPEEGAEVNSEDTRVKQAKVALNQSLAMSNKTQKLK